MFKAIPWWEDGRGNRYYFVHFDFINLLTILWAFAICLQPPADPCALPESTHYFCREYIYNLQPSNGRLLCPLCRRQFTLDQIQPCIPTGETTYHRVDLEQIRSFFSPSFPILPTAAPIFPIVRGRAPPTVSVNVPYCVDSLCPGGPNARCGRRHDLRLRQIFSPFH